MGTGWTTFSGKMVDRIQTTMIIPVVNRVERDAEGVEAIGNRIGFNEF